MNSQSLTDVTPTVKHLALEYCVGNWGFDRNKNIPDWALSQAIEHINYKENDSLLGSQLVEQELFTLEQIEAFEKNKTAGVMLGQHICTELEHQKSLTKKTQVQRAICMSKNEGVLFVDNFPCDEIVPHPLLQDKKVSKKLLDECSKREALIIRIGGETNAVMFSDIDKAKEFRDRLARQEQASSHIYKELDSFNIVVSSPDNILDFLGEKLEHNTEDMTTTHVVTEMSLQSTAEHKKITKIWNHAMALGATDIHFDPSANENDKWVNIKFRVHGELIDFTEEYKILSAGEYKTILGKIGQLSNASQTGGSRFVIPVDPDRIAYVSAANKKTEMRLEILPKGHGETGGREQKIIIIRLFNHDETEPTFANLNISKNAEHYLSSLVKVRNKFHLVSGTTGSGKNTTICAMLNAYNAHYNNRRKVYSLERPVEKLISNVSQIQITKVAEKEFLEQGKDVWLGFLEGIVRSDPDAVFLGEIRSESTASLAGQIAASGHELFSTFHATTPRSTVNRILDMFSKDSQRATFIDSLGSIITQRLVKKLCSCHVKRVPTDEEAQHIKTEMSVHGIKSQDLEDALTKNVEFAFQNFDGCDVCKNTGVDSVVPVNGILVVSETRRMKMLSDNKADFYNAFVEPEVDINSELINKILSFEVSLMEL